MSSLNSNPWGVQWGPSVELQSDLPPSPQAPVSHGDRPASPTTLTLFDALPFNKIIPVSTYSPTFTCFPYLPLEIRLAIWKMTFLPRVVEMQFDFHLGFSSAAPLPVAFQINRESRELAVEKYPKCFGSRMYPRRTVFNFSMDTMYLQGAADDFISHLFGVMTIQEMTDLRYLAMDHGLVARPTTKNFLKLALKQLPRLENLFIIYDLPEFGRSRSCTNINCMVFRDNIPYELIGSPRIETIEKKFKESNWAEVDSVDPSRCKKVYGWQECQCEDLESDSESSGDEWEDEDSDGFGDYDEYEDSDGYAGLANGVGWTNYEIYGDDMSDDMFSD